MISRKVTTGQAIFRFKLIRIIRTRHWLTIGTELSMQQYIAGTPLGEILESETVDNISRIRRTCKMILNQIQQNFCMCG